MHSGITISISSDTLRDNSYTLDYLCRYITSLAADNQTDESEHTEYARRFLQKFASVCRETSRSCRQNPRNLIPKLTIFMQSCLFVLLLQLYCPSGIPPMANSGCPPVRAGCSSVSIIHQTLTWTTGSLTCAQM